MITTPRATASQVDGQRHTARCARRSEVTKTAATAMTASGLNWKPRNRSTIPANNCARRPCSMA
ncbi:MAG: hypothetical protein WCJ30_06325 [Deltaproteobacteria bacterium]